MMGSGCKPSSLPPEAARAAQNRPAGGEAAFEGRSPADVARLLHDHHVARDYGGIAGLIEADRREVTIAFLKAVDGVLEAHARLSTVAEGRFGGPMSDTWSLAAMENNLGVFSKNIDIINHRFSGGTATVVLQEGENGPLVRARFVRTAQGWRHRPEPMPRSVIGELGSLAAILVDITASIEQGLDFEGYVKAFLGKVLPQMGRVVMSRDESDVVLGTAVE